MIDVHITFTWADIIGIQLRSILIVWWTNICEQDNIAKKGGAVLILMCNYQRYAATLCLKTYYDEK